MSKTTAESTSASRSAPSEQAPVTIGGLARAAEVGVETIRYYQSRRLLAVPQSTGSIRRYSRAVVERIRFIK